MALIKTILGKTPKFGHDCYLSENACVIGEVEMGDNCSVWFNAVVRGDVNYIKIGNRVNIQDGSCLHTLYQKAAIEIGDGAIIAAGSLVLKNTRVGEGELWGGVPAKFIKKVAPEQAKELNKDIAGHYLMYTKWFTDENPDTLINPTKE